MIRQVFIFFIFIMLLFSPDNLFCQAPKVKVVSVKRIFDNGEHNAFTDMVNYKGNFYLTFRSCPDGHAVHPTSSIIILRSKDAKEWRQVNRFSVKYRDTRDPKFLVFKNKLFVYTGTWYYGDPKSKRKDFTINEHLGYAVRTENGMDWSEPQLLEGTYGHYIWRAAAYDDKAYICARRRHNFLEIFPPGENRSSIMESAMLESENGLVWKKKALFQERWGDETAFLFKKDGSVLAVARRGRGNAELCRAKKPWTTWERTDLGEYIGGPLLVKWGKYYLVGGRKKTEQGYKTALSWLIDGELHTFAVLPSGGDNSYPGFIELSPTRALISYYSSHEKYKDGKTKTAIYLAEIRIIGE